jgi:hypothetical protein
MNHDDLRFLAAGAALGDLDPDEWRAHAEHEVACGECAGLGVELRACLTDLSLLAPRRVPPVWLGASVLAAVRAEGVVVAPRPVATASQSVDGALSRAVSAAPRVVSTPPPAIAPVVPISGARSRRGSFYAAVGLAAVLAVVALGLGATATRLSSDLTQARAEASALHAEAAGDAALMAALADPSHRTARLQAESLAPQAAAVVVYVPGTTEAWIVADHMPATPTGRAYQLWYADASGAHPLETASWNGQGVMVAPVAVDLAHSAAVMVTLEPAGGATGDPGPQVVFGELGA